MIHDLYTGEEKELDVDLKSFVKKDNEYGSFGFLVTDGKYIYTTFYTVEEASHDIVDVYFLKINPKTKHVQPLFKNSSRISNQMHEFFDKSKNLINFSNRVFLDINNRTAFAVIPFSPWIPNPEN